MYIIVIYFILLFNIFFLLACDGWSNPSNESIWNFVIHTTDRHQYLWSLRNLSGERYTQELLAEEIRQVLEKIGPQKFSAIVTDAGANVQAARHIITEEYPNILNIRCIAHAINLISKDICKTLFADRMLKCCNNLVTYFKTSHLAGKLK